MKQGLIVKRPNGKAKSYSVIPYTRDLTGKKVYGERLENEALASLNKLLKTGELTAAQAALQFEHVVLPQLKNDSKKQNKVLAEAQVSEKNLQWFTKFWSKEYESKDLSNPKTAYDEFIAALRGIEPLSLMTSSRETLQAKINKSWPEGGRNKKYGGRINQLLSYYERGFVLHLKSPPTPTVAYVSLQEFKKLQANIFVYLDNQQRINVAATAAVRDLCEYLFGSGKRFGEAFVLKPRDLKANGSVFVSKQVKRDGSIDDLKNNKPHYTLLLEETVEAAKRWASLDEKEQYRGSIAYRAFKRAARQTFKDKDRQSLTIHDLRHCYAVHLLGLGVPLDKVAKLIGDTVATAELHYAGFVASDAEIDFIKSIVRKSGS